MAQTAPVSEDQFLPENAILDTSILFAIGAREARQELRGSYGWPTFQEGIVDQIYFRFDPDGYARFSPSSRLDSDVFEVLCRARTADCMGRKGALSLGLDANGKFQLTLEGISDGDQFFIADGTTEIQIPRQILDPLDARYENVLSVGGDLIAKRGQEEILNVSLTGFAQVASYLRWVHGGQDYLALPRNWPIPGRAVEDSSSFTQTENWRGDQLAENVLPSNSEGTTAAELQQMITALTLANSQIGAATVETETVPETSGVHQDDVLLSIMARLDDISFRLSVLEQRGVALEMPELGIHDPIPMEVSMPSEMEPDNSEELETLARQLDEIMAEFHVDAPTAAILLRLRQNETGATEPDALSSLHTILSTSDSTGLSDAIFSESLLGDTTASVSETSMLDEQVAAENEQASDTSTSEFVLFTDYFQSVAEQQE